LGSNIGRDFLPKLDEDVAKHHLGSFLHKEASFCLTLPPRCP
jgi:hypothetical protein